MTILLHEPETPLHSSEGHTASSTGTAGGYLAAMKRICRWMLVGLLAACALAAIIALRTAIYFWRFHF
jgi:hypothetical protein